MDKHSEQQTLIPTQKHEAQPPLVIEYPQLVNAVQLSVAREENTSGAFDTDSFTELLTTLEEKKRIEIQNTLNERFDETLINFVRCAVIARRNRIVTIRVEEAKGTHENFAWELPLKDHLKSTLAGADLYIDRVVKPDPVLVEFGAVALEQVLEPAY